MSNPVYDSASQGRIPGPAAWEPGTLLKLQNARPTESKSGLWGLESGKLSFNLLSR